MEGSLACSAPVYAIITVIIVIIKALPPFGVLEISVKKKALQRAKPVLTLQAGRAWHGGNLWAWRPPLPHWGAAPRQAHPSYLLPRPRGTAPRQAHPYSLYPGRWQPR